MLTLPPLEFC